MLPMSGKISSGYATISLACMFRCQGLHTHTVTIFRNLDVVARQLVRRFCELVTYGIFNCPAGFWRKGRGNLLVASGTNPRKQVRDE